MNSHYKTIQDNAVTIAEAERQAIKMVNDADNAIKVAGNSVRFSGKSVRFSSIGHDLLLKL